MLDTFRNGIISSNPHNLEGSTGEQREVSDLPTVASLEGSGKGFTLRSGPFFLQAPFCMCHNQRDSGWTGGV